MRKLLLPFSWIFRFIVFFRNKLYDNGYFKRVVLSAKVISVGNISVGGTGKTPFVELIARYLVKKGKFVIVVTKGYKRESDDMQVVEFGYKNEDHKLTAQNFGDESIMLMENFGDIPKRSGLLIAADNKRSGSKLADSKFKPDVIILDDGFQKRNIHRDLDIVILNTQYKGHLIPAGNFREPYSSTHRADIRVLNRKFDDSMDLNLSKLGKIPEYKYENENFINLENKCLQEKKINAIAFCGIGDPGSFKKLLDVANIIIKQFLVFPDHYSYKQEDIEKIINSFNSSGAEYILTTQKDFVRFKYSIDLYTDGKNIIKEFLYNYPVYYSKLQLKFTENQDILFDKLDKLIRD